MKRTHTKAVVLIIDALRYDFALYNTSLDDALPYQNKLKVIHEVLLSSPRHGALFKFVADPPTTTMQRLKALTTGSLPTFVDAGSNFASSNITEENIISQLTSLKKKITFMGDDTWGSLFPDSFHKSFPFPSFNVMDLHTVDNGVIEHLVPELKANDWDVLIGHFLGVDHCGHRFGPNHPEMASKLTQMDSVLRSVMEILDDDTILFVMGDHGMTRTGDHGGDSDDEVDAALFIYSTKPIAACKMKKEKVVTVSQIDLVPTLSLLLGLPIPFGNLGTIIPELFCHRSTLDILSNQTSSEDDLNAQQVLELLQRNKAFELNAKQVHKYLTKYASISGDIPKERLEELGKILHNATTLVSEVKDLVDNLGGHEEMIRKASGEELKNLNEKLSSAEEFHSDYLSGAKVLCRSMWAKFDLNSIFTGISVISVGVALVVLALLNFSENRLSLLFLVPLIGFVIASAATSCDFNAIIIIPLYVACALLLALFVFLQKKFMKYTQITVSRFYKKLSVVNIFAAVLCLLQCWASFSNSFVVNEDRLTAFFIQSLIGVNCVQAMWKICPGNSRNIVIRHHFRRFAKKDDMKNISGFILRLLIAWIAFDIVSRTAIILRACREEQWSCVQTDLLKPQSNSADKTTLESNRFILTVLCTGTIPFSIHQWLRYHGNLNGTTFIVLCVRYTLPLAFFFMCIHWMLQIVPQEMAAVFPEMQLWQQIIFPQIVYSLCMATIACVLYSPLYIYTVFKNGRNSLNEGVKSLQETGDNSRIIHALVREVKQNWERLDVKKVKVCEDDTNTPMVYGLGTVFSSAILVLIVAVGLPLMMLLGNGMALSISLILFQMYLQLEIHGLSHDAELANGGDRNSDTSFSMVVVWYFMSSYYFYCTGHQATIPSIRFEAAFVGFPGDMENLVIPGLLILLNTFSSAVLFSLGLPLLLFWPQIQNRLLATRNKNRPQSSKGEFDWIESPELLRTRMFRLLVTYQTLHGLKLLATCCSAAVHRRHLMVWKIFAPRFVFEGVSFLLLTMVLCLSYLVVLRIDQSLRSWFKNLEESHDWKAKNT
ncbi:GPI ethanolamine phosphate transferase 3 [Stylophora pistillata]|uniref:GPI ethanolamine phosphate transferase 3, catalytic subunit n=2 Tax=Stylophora pistillata TaxID=50429 RepID=A0A2B4RTF3_STYPI|nr:GPI ethanolamine phosphate transferase 3 [Stylophora pistillata]